jgi:hypothetical protein
MCISRASARARATLVERAAGDSASPLAAWTPAFAGHRPYSVSKQVRLIPPADDVVHHAQAIRLAALRVEHFHHGQAAPRSIVAQERIAQDRRRQNFPRSAASRISRWPWASLLAILVRFAPGGTRLGGDDGVVDVPHKVCELQGLWSQKYSAILRQRGGEGGGSRQ